jgi:hypothetical protein
MTPRQTPPGWLPFTTQEAREQCESFGIAPMAHPLPINHQLMLLRAIDELRTALTEATRDRA